MSIAKILKKHSRLVPGKIKITEFFFEVPLDYSKPDSTHLRLFARSAEKFENPVEPAKDEPKHTPWLAYLQGGPGFGCGTPQNDTWTKFILDKGYQILMMDQRGTGMSNTITAATLARQGGPKEQAAYLKHFRADNIVKDMEAIRKVLTKDYPENKKKWSIMGQSFGGFCSVNYLSKFPEGLKEVFLTGGLPPLAPEPDVIYRKLYKRSADRSYAYYEKYPEDIQRVKNIVGRLTKQEIKTYSGGIISVSRLRQLGQVFGFHGGFDGVHRMLLRMENDIEMFGEFTRPTIQEFDSFGAFEGHILYALVHEPCYLSSAASNWSADRMIHEFPEFNAATADCKEPILFTAEMIFKSMFTDFDELRPLYETADLINQASDWPDLYDEAQLAKNTVPVYAAVFFDDLYVDFDFSMETAGKIRGCRTFLTNSMYHDALGSKADEVLKELFKLRDDVID